MSGGLVNLVSKGIQDSYLISGTPDSSLFRMRYTRHSNFAQVPYKISDLIIPENSTKVIEIPSKGDILTYMWFEGVDMFSQFRGCRLELRIGGQIVDRQSSTFLTDVWPVYMPDSYTKASVINNSTSSSNKTFQPLHFFFNDNWQHIPLVALQYHKVEIVITTTGNAINAKMYGNFVFVDTKERTALVEGPKQFIITQVQEFFTDAVDGEVASIDLSHLNHPVRSIFWGASANSSDMSRDYWTFSEADLYLNGTPYFENMSPTYFHSVQGYYCTPTGMINMDPITNTPFFTRFYTYNFCMNSSSYKPTGSCNFSRMDNAKLVIKGLSRGSNHAAGGGIHVIAVNYNVLKIERGLGGVLFSN
jgi:hypothetical protein